MKNMNGYYDFSGQKFGYPLSLSINGFSQNIFARQSSLEISYVLQGTYEAVTEHFSCTLKEHEMIVIAPYDIHMVSIKDEEDKGLILTIHIDFSRMAEAMVGDPAMSFCSSIFTKDKNSKIYFSLKRKIGELIKMLMKEKSNLLQLNVLMAELVFLSAVKEQPSMEELPLQSEQQENYMKAIRYIDEHCKEPLSLGDVAQQLSFSPSYTSKLLKKYTGIPFIKYLSYVRVRNSLESLLEGKEQIEEIALDCGMANGKAYTTTFKELYGILPSAYRKQFQHNLRYNEHRNDQKMELSEEQTQFLMHLFEEHREILYEDEKILIWKENNMLCCESKETWKKVEWEPEGKFKIHFDEKRIYNEG